MKKFIFCIILLVGLFCFPQGGPKVNTVKFIGNITTQIRDTWDVPIGETWLIYNTTVGGLQYSNSNDIWLTITANGTASGGFFATTAQNFLEIEENGPIGGTDFIRFSGGTSPDNPLFYITDNYAELANYSNADIDNVGGNSLITRRWVVDYINGLPPSSSSSSFSTILGNARDNVDLNNELDLKANASDIVGFLTGGSNTIESNFTLESTAPRVEITDNTTALLSGPSNDLTRLNVFNFGTGSRGVSINISGGNPHYQLDGSYDQDQDVARKVDVDNAVASISTGSGTGDVTQSGNNTYTGDNTFDGDVVVNGFLEINNVAFNSSVDFNGNDLTSVNTLRVANISSNSTVPIIVERDFNLSDNRISSLGTPVFDQDATNKIYVDTQLSNVTAGGITPQSFQDIIYETQLPNGVYTKFIKLVTQAEYDALPNEDIYGLNGVEYYISPSVPSGYSITNVDSADPSNVSFNVENGEIGSGIDWSITDGTTTIDGFLRPVENATTSFTGLDFSSLADGSHTLTVSLVNGGGRGVEVTELINMSTVAGVAHYENRAGALITGSDTSVGGWVSGNGISESSTTQARTGTTSLKIASNEEGTRQFRSFDFSSGASGQTDFTGGETVTIRGYIYAPSGSAPEIQLTSSSLSSRTAIPFTPDTFTEFVFTGINVTSSGNFTLYTTSTSGIYIDDLTIISN